MNRSQRAGAALILFLTVTAYIPALRGGFIWDDDDYVTNNKSLRSADGLRQIWVNPDVTSQYYPLTFTVFWIEYHLWGLHPFGFHLVNVLLQAANAVLFWRLLSGLRVPGAWWAAAVFAVHPVHVMSVAWITELKNVLSGFCFLGALLAYLRFCGLNEDHRDQHANRKLFYGLAVGLYICALLSKTATSIFPVAVLLMIWWKKGRIGRKELLPVLPLLVVGILCGVFTLWLEKYEKGAYGQEFTLPFLDRVLIAGRSFWFGLGKLLWPSRLTFIYPRWEIKAGDVFSYLYPLGALASLVGLWWARSRIGRAPFASLLYFTMAFPALVMIQVLYMMRFTFVSDHWQYLASMSIIPLCVAGVVTALDRLNIASLRIRLTFGAIVIAVLGFLTWRQGYVYQNLETLWRDTLAKNPKAWIAHNNLGMILRDQGKLSEAKVRYQDALRLNPNFAEAHNNIGGLLVHEDKIPEAIAHWQEALRIKPTLADAHYNWACALMLQGKAEEAIAHWKEAARLKPEDAQTHCDLGAALGQVGRLEEGVSECEQALRLKPDYAEAHYNLGLTLARLGRMPEAIEHWEQAVRFKPDYAEAHFNLGVALEETGRRTEAIAHYEQALRIYPDDVEAKKRLARLRTLQ